MSSIRFAFFVFFFYFCASSTNGQEDKTKEEEEFILQQKEYPSACPQIPNPLDRSPRRPWVNKLIEEEEFMDYNRKNIQLLGRWYIIRSGLLPEQAKTLTCEVFDLSYDYRGDLEILLSVNEAGEFKIRSSKLIKKKTTHGIIYASESDASYKGVIRFEDRDFFIFISVACKGKPTHTRGLVVGVRKFPADPSIIQRINSLIQDLERKGFKSDVTEILHSNCTYPPYKFSAV